VDHAEHVAGGESGAEQLARRGVLDPAEHPTGLSIGRDRIAPVQDVQRREQTKASRGGFDSLSLGFDNAAGAFAQPPSTLFQPLSAACQELVRPETRPVLGQGLDPHHSGPKGAPSRPVQFRPQFV